MVSSLTTSRTRKSRGRSNQRLHKTQDCTTFETDTNKKLFALMNNNDET